ncbi:MAG: hypothetical protein RLZZ595_2066 [Bacteroidota bacterium]
MNKIALVLFCFLLSNVSSAQFIADFKKPATNPLLGPDSSYTFFCPVQKKDVQWQKADVFNPAAIVRNDTVFLLFRAEDNKDAKLGHRTSRIGLAVSTDGIHFKRYPKPVLFPDVDEMQQWDYPGGCEDPRVVQTEDGTYLMLYTSWNSKVARLSSAISKDLIHWKKQGPVFLKAHQGKFNEGWSKSGSVITKMVNGKIVAAKMNGKYWMYWGENFVNLAYSENLQDWYPLLDKQGELLKVMETRPYKFDSHLVECGPPAMITDEGIILIYNGRNIESDLADPNLPKGMYASGQALFDKNDPTKFLKRLDQPFMKPDLPHEITGQYKAGTTFAEGLVRFKNQWFLYYGTADSMVGVAISK